MTRLRPTTPALSLLVMLLPLAACGGRAAAPAPAPGADLPGHAECRAEARDSPELRSLARTANPGNSTNEYRIAQQAAEVERRAFVDCLRRRGFARPGGVEPLQRRPLL